MEQEKSDKNNQWTTTIWTAEHKRLASMSLTILLTHWFSGFVADLTCGTRFRNRFLCHVATNRSGEQHCREGYRPHGYFSDTRHRWRIVACYTSSFVVVNWGMKPWYIVFMCMEFLKRCGGALPPDAVDILNCLQHAQRLHKRVLFEINL